VHIGESFRQLADDSETVAGHVHGGLQVPLHLLASVGGGVVECIKARFLVRDGAAEPHLETG